MEFTVGKFASMVNTTVRTLRYYEKIGLLVPKNKNDLNQKVYVRDELQKFYNIQLLKSMGWPLNEIKQMLEETEYSFRDMLEMQEAVLLDHRNKINLSLDMMKRMKKVMNETGDINNEDLMLLMNTIRLEEDQRTILEQHFSLNTVGKIMPINKNQQITLDLLNRRLLSFFQTTIHRELRPDSPEVQRELTELLAMVPESIQEFTESDLGMVKQLEVFKALLPVGMVELIGEAIQVLYQDQCEENGEQV
ncbi:MerR family transcriptional regulator [Paenibacillus amylolyticus]|nr:MerR family transcriptional regulator [Paenibacillus amylolyticus]WFR61076.1 MerR family transcriptional regulator [Paenibacillus amylolyticus]